MNPQTVLTVFVGIVAPRRWPAASDPINSRTVLPVVVGSGSEPLAGGPALAWRRAQWTARARGGAWLQALPDELDEAFSFSCDDS